MTGIRRETITAWTVALLALLPPALLVYLGSLTRLRSDDYCHIAWGESYGILGGLRHVRDTWNGSYSNYFVQFLFESRGEVAPAFFAMLTIAIWLIGLAWLTLIVLKLLRVEENRLPLALAFSGLLVASTINGLQSAQSQYWMAAIVSYALPAAVLVLILAIGLELLLRPSLPISAAAGLIAVACFLNAGFSPMHLVFQGGALTMLVLGVMFFLRNAKRRRCLVLLSAGWLSTGAAALILMTAPGFSGRMNSRVYAELNLGSPIRALPELVLRSLEIMVEQVGHQPAFTGFALMLCLTFCATLSVYRPRRASGTPPPAVLAKGPLWAALIAQLLPLPMLWTHTSDATQFLGRFSAAFFLVICLNLAQIFTFALLLAFSKRINLSFRSSESNRRAYIVAILLAVVLLSAMDQARSIHYRAATYLLSSVFALLCLLLWQLADRVPEADSRLWRQLPLFAAGAALFNYLALIALSLFALGFLTERVLVGATFLHVASGAVWGLGLGLLLQRSGLLSQSDNTARRWYQGGAALAVIVLAVGLVGGQSQRLQPLTAFATEWDARNKEIIRQRDSGRDAIVVPELSYTLGDVVHGFHIFDDTFNYCAKLHYGVESITRSGDG